MRRTRFVVVAAVLVVLVAAACGSSKREFSNRIGECTFEPHAVCPNQDLTAVNAVSGDLTGADFSGADLTGADLHDATLRDVKFTGTDLTKADLTGADLRGADLSDATLFRASLLQADWGGSNRAGMKVCQTILPDGSVSDCPTLSNPGIGLTPTTQPPPTVVRFAPHRPVRCLVDAIGEGIEVDWKVRNASSVTFAVDEDRVSTSSGVSGGIKRIPFPCDDARHTVSIQAFGSTAFAERDFTLSVAPARPSSSPS